MSIRATASSTSTLDAPERDAAAPAASPPRSSSATSPPGEKAYVAVAAVDLGILNLTNFKTPDPDGWYFGQRQLGIEIRDLYGSLIDPTQGAARRAALGRRRRRVARSARRRRPRCWSRCIRASSRSMPTARRPSPSTCPTSTAPCGVMAMAWTDTAVGHASADVIVRDPVVVTLSPPRFLRARRQSRLLVEINNVSRSGRQLQGRARSPAKASPPTRAETDVDLAAGERTALNLGAHRHRDRRPAAEADHHRARRRRAGQGTDARRPRRQRARRPPAS